MAEIKQIDKGELNLRTTPEAVLNFLGPILSVVATADELGNNTRFLIDTGASVSIISSNALKSATITKSRIPIRALSGNYLPIIGFTKLKLVLNNHILPGYNFWVTSNTFKNFDGIIGTDILTDLKATIDCPKQEIQIFPESLVPNGNSILISCQIHADTDANVRNINSVLNQKHKKKALQLVTLTNIIVPPQSHMILSTVLRCTPLLNSVFDVPNTMLRADGVLIGHCITKIQEDGTVYVPVLNMSPLPYIIKKRSVLTLVNPVDPGSCPPVGQQDHDVGHDQSSTIGGGSAPTGSPNTPANTMEPPLPRYSSEHGAPKDASQPYALYTIKADNAGYQPAEEEQALASNPRPEGGNPTPTTQPAEDSQPSTPTQQGGQDVTGWTTWPPQPTLPDAPAIANDEPCGASAGTADRSSIAGGHRRLPAGTGDGDRSLEGQVDDAIKQEHQVNPLDYSFSETETRNTHEKEVGTNVQKDTGHQIIKTENEAQANGIETEPDTTANSERLDKQLAKAYHDAQVPEEYAGEFYELLKSYKHIFRTEGDPTYSCPLFEQAIPLTDDKPVIQKQYPLPQAAKEALNERIEEFLKAKIIKPSTSVYNSAIWMVPKKDGKWRMCLDFRALNKKVESDPFPLPRIEETLEAFNGTKYMSAADLFWGFYHVKVKPADTHKLAFTTSTGRYEFLQLPMGLKISPAVFQRMMNLVCKDYLNKFLLVYMDDLIIYSPSAEQHLKDLNHTFSRLDKAGLRLKIDKCQFFQTKLKYLGFVVSQEGISLDPDKVSAVRNFPKPDKDLGRLQSFLGLVGYFKRHISHYAKRAKPLYDMLRGEEVHKKKRKGKKHCEFKQQTWGSEQDKAFEDLKLAATTAPVLAYPDFTKPFILTTDASGDAMGWVLSQKTEDGEHPIAYGSRLLKGSELNYSNTKRETHAVIQGIEHFRSYLYGRYFIVRTDHQPITMIHNKKDLTRSVCNWILATQDYFFDIEYVPGKSIPHADALSRMFPAKQKNINSSIQACFYEAELEQEWTPCLDYTGWGEEQKKDPILRRKYKIAIKGRDQNYAIKNTVLFQLVEGSTPTDKRYLPLVPRCLQAKLIRQFHGPPAAGHLGPERTYQQMKQFVYWTGMHKDITAFVEKCDLCQRNKRSYLRVPMQKQRIPCGIFDTVSMDIVGPIVPSTRGEKYILVIQDQLSKWVELVPLRSTETDKILEKFMDRWVLRYGPPERLLTDRASNFLSAASQEFCRFFGIEKVNTTAYRPQGNASNERMHQEMVKYLSIYLDGVSQSKWNIMLGEAAFAYNTSYNSILRMSPFEVLFGQLPALGPLGIPRNAEANEDFEKYYEQRQDQLSYKRQLAQNAISRWQDMIIKQRNRFAHEMKFAVGDKVLYKNHVPKTKFDQKFKGPWKIIRVMSPVLYELEFEDKKFIAHAKYMKPYKEDSTSVKDKQESRDFINVDISSDEEQIDESNVENEAYIEDITKNRTDPVSSSLTPSRHFSPISHSTPRIQLSPKTVHNEGISAPTPQKTPSLSRVIRNLFTPPSRNSQSVTQEKRNRRPPKYMKDNYVMYK